HECAGMDQPLPSRGKEVMSAELIDTDEIAPNAPAQPMTTCETNCWSGPPHPLGLLRARPSGQATAATPKQLMKYRRVNRPRSMCSPRCRSASSTLYHQGRCSSLGYPEKVCPTISARCASASLADLYALSGWRSCGVVITRFIR